MEKIILRYKRSRTITMTVLILLWIGLMSFSIIEILNGMEFRIYTYIWLVLGTLYISTYAYSLYKQYATIKGKWLYINELPFKKINLNKLTDVKTFAGDYTLKSNKEELLINTQIMEESSRKAFEEIIDQNFSKNIS